MNDQIDGLTFFTILWPVISIIGILANLTVIFVLPTKKQTPTEYFCLNLAISDLLFLTVCPTMVLISLHGMIIYDDLPFFLSNIICKSNYFLTYLSVFITCLTLMTMTFDRFYVITFPFNSIIHRSKNKALLINVFIWIISIILSVPQGFLRTLIQTNISNEFYSNISNLSISTELICSSADFIIETVDFRIFKLNIGQLDILFIVFISYVMPLVTIIICYMIMILKLCKRKNSIKSENALPNKVQKTLIMIASVTILFGVSWFPIHSIYFAMKFFKDFPFENDLLFLTKNIAHTLTYLNSMLNPFFYTIMSNSFRISLNFKMSRYSASFRLSNNNFNQTSILMKRISPNGSMRHKNSSTYVYRSIIQRNEN